MGTYYSEKDMLLKFQDYWRKFHPELGDFHKNWLLKSGQVLPMVKGMTLVSAEDRQSAIYIVLAGILVKQRYCPHRNRYNIMNVALPHMGIFTTIHFYSKSPALGDISCLRSGLVLKIPYKAIIPYRQNERAIDTMVNVDQQAETSARPPSGNGFYPQCDRTLFLFCRLSTPSL